MNPLELLAAQEQKINESAKKLANDYVVRVDRDDRVSREQAYLVYKISNTPIDAIMMGM